MHNSHGLRHASEKHKKEQLFSRKQKNWIDHFIYFAVFASPASLLPQVLKIYANKNAESIAVVSWAIMVTFATVWLIYGLAHKNKPIIISNALWITAYGAILTGALLY